MMDNNSWERELDGCLHFASDSLEMMETVKRKWGTLLSAVATPLAFVFFFAVVLLTSPWGLFLVAARIWERR